MYGTGEDELFLGYRLLLALLGEAGLGNAPKGSNAWLRWRWLVVRVNDLALPHDGTHGCVVALWLNGKCVGKEARALVVVVEGAVDGVEEGALSWASR